MIFAHLSVVVKDSHEGILQRLGRIWNWLKPIFRNFFGFNFTISDAVSNVKRYVKCILQIWVADLRSYMHETSDQEIGSD